MRGEILKGTNEWSSRVHPSAECWRSSEDSKDCPEAGSKPTTLRTTSKRLNHNTKEPGSSELLELFTSSHLTGRGHTSKTGLLSKKWMQINHVRCVLKLAFLMGATHWWTVTKVSCKAPHTPRIYLQDWWVKKLSTHSSIPFPLTGWELHTLPCVRCLGTGDGRFLWGRPWLLLLTLQTQQLFNVNADFKWFCLLCHPRWIGLKGQDTVMLVLLFQFSNYDEACSLRLVL